MLQGNFAGRSVAEREILEKKEYDFFDILRGGECAKLV